ncbi:hypothetical protein E4631_14510 [Hymenobacter sp. UV11]|uniref:hypothetical protein n=1 Tax=Hymenobacter sp. UV11 TaxID=1849735 RepID=UPI0010617FC5|nr:hypothetical protein [Hymenobacter sp. UV11]TDN39465.1 hypothetical protein A8B98_19705 [Hymenobacter sp. UV11]TFZ65443.1 hypothetical protein E4631_14510 [Hymenobacter sp. UV11]
MSPTQFSTDFLQIAYRPDLGHLTGRWLRSVAEAELHTGYAALRQAALHHGCGHWLIDSRRRTNRSLNGPEWVTTQFLPQVQQALGQPLRVCFLVLPGYLASLPNAAQVAAPDSPVQFARFVDEGAANAWLAGG